MGLRSWLDLPVEMGWRHVLFANWPVEPGVVEPHLPEPLGVDTVAGRAWLSVVPFTNVAVRPKGVPASLGFRLPELNLRTYVTHDSGDGTLDSAAIYFFSLDADGIRGVTGARVFHHLPYYYADIRMETVGNRVTPRSDTRPGRCTRRLRRSTGTRSSRRTASRPPRATRRSCTAPAWTCSRPAAVNPDQPADCAGSPSDSVTGRGHSSAASTTS